MSDYRVDSHKLIYHPGRVVDWVRGEKIYPILLEVGIAGACNHRCVFCAVSHMNHQPTYLDSEIFMEQLKKCMI